MNELHMIGQAGGVVECRIDDALMPGVLRVLTGTTPVDADVDALPIPTHPTWLRFAVRALRWYRAQVAPRMGQRCVFEPSCSRYAELALRNHGAFRGLVPTVERLGRCRPGLGGLDLP